MDSASPAPLGFTSVESSPTPRSPMFVVTQLPSCAFCSAEHMQALQSMFVQSIAIWDWETLEVLVVVVGRVLRRYHN